MNYFKVRRLKKIFLKNINKNDCKIEFITKYSNHIIYGLLDSYRRILINNEDRVSYNKKIKYSLINRAKELKIESCEGIEPIESINFNSYIKIIHNTLSIYYCMSLDKYIIEFLNKIMYESLIEYCNKYGTLKIKIY